MQCPHCKRGSSRRSRRRGLHEYLFSLVGVYPWRCRICERRFYAALVPLRHIFYAHCPRCGNFNLERASPNSRFLGRLPCFSMLRCDLCRLNFVTLRPLRAPPARAASAPEGSPRDNEQF
jgi:hypothetical protein